MTASARFFIFHELLERSVIAAHTWRRRRERVAPPFYYQFERLTVHTVKYVFSLSRLVLSLYLTLDPYDFRAFFVALWTSFYVVRFTRVFCCVGDVVLRRSDIFVRYQTSIRFIAFRWEASVPVIPRRVVSHPYLPVSWIYYPGQRIVNIIIICYSVDYHFVLVKYIILLYFFYLPTTNMLPWFCIAYQH